MSPQKVTKRTVRSHSVLFLILTFKSVALSSKYGADILQIEDLFNETLINDDINNMDERFTINTEGCMIPLVNGNDTLRTRYFRAENNLPVCRNYKHPLITTNETHIMTVDENFKFYGKIYKENFTCCYKSFYRPRSSIGISNKTLDERIRYTPCKTFKDIVEVKHEFVEVTCFYKNAHIYANLFAFTPKKSFTTYREDPFANNQSLYNIIVMGLGSISRKNFYRTMPKTRKLLTHFGAVELKGYSTVASNTFNNLMAFLTGVNITQLENICLPNRLATLDSCPFIWERFKDIGYYTALAEDSANLGIFNLNNFGYRGTPTDYYIHPFIRQSEILKKQKGPFSCMGDKYYFEGLLNYIDSLTTTLSTSKLFGLFWEKSMSYNNLKHPEIMDNAYVKLIEQLHSSGYLNKTMLILLSDHGMNIGKIISTKQGRLEQRLPLVNILFPNNFREKFRLAYHNLRLNGDRLTTPFDLHSTLIDLLDLTGITNSEIIKRSVQPYSRERAISLFLKVPLNRTCAMAGIHKKWCSCYKNVRVSVNDILIARAVGFLSWRINEQLKPYPRCFKLTIVKILKAYELQPGYEKNLEWRTFMIIVRTMPGGGIFEAILHHNKGWTLVNPVKRLNAISKNYCVGNNYIRLFCYCA